MTVNCLLFSPFYGVLPTDVEHDKMVDKHSQSVLADPFAKETEKARASKDLFSDTQSTSFASTSVPFKQTYTSADDLSNRDVMNAIMNLSSEFKEFKKQGHMSMAFFNMQGRI